MGNVPPWQQDGAEVVKAYVFSCSVDGSEPFVGYLEKYTLEAKTMIEEAQADPERDMTDVTERFTGNEVLLKRPGQPDWLPTRHPAASSVRQVRCSDGTLARAVLPRD